VELVRPGFGDYVHGRAGVRPESRRDGVGLNAEFLQSIGEWKGILTFDMASVASPPLAFTSRRYGPTGRLGRIY
jgi:hypothetical protein